MPCLMKKALFILLFFLSSIVYTNPIFYSYLISEIYFDESGDWILEIGIDEPMNFEFWDSLYLETNSGIALITLFDTATFTPITNENLSNDLAINKDNDRIVLHTNFIDYLNDTVLLGEAEGSYLKNIEYGQSIARQYIYPNLGFYKTNSPTIGYPNSIMEGTLGFIHGYVFDHTGMPIINLTFEIAEGYWYAWYFSTDDNGYYQAPIVSRSYYNDALLIPDGSSYGTYDLLPIDPVHFEINENDTLNINFTQTITSIAQQPKQTMLLSNYPNPAREYTYFIFDYEATGVEQVKLKIMDTQGREVETLWLNESPFLWQTGHLQPGTYIYQLYVENEMVGSNKLILVR